MFFAYFILLPGFNGLLPIKTNRYMTKSPTSVSQSDHIRAKALIMTIEGQCSTLSPVMDSLAKSLDTPQNSKGFALKFVDPLFRAIQLCRLAEVDLHLSKGPYTRSWVDACMDDVRKAAASRVPVSARSSKRTANLVHHIKSKVDSLSSFVGGMIPEEPLDPGRRDPLRIVDPYYKKSLRAKRKVFSTFSEIFDLLSKVYSSLSFHATATKNLRSISKQLRNISVKG